MDDAHFDCLVRSLNVASSRRWLVRGIPAWGLAATGFSNVVEAKKNRGRKRRRRKRRKRRNRDSPPPPPPFCAGIDVCLGQEISCGASGADCRCFVTADTGEPFCGQNTGLTPCMAGCDLCCFAEETCIACSNGVICALPCPSPLEKEQPHA